MRTKIILLLIAVLVISVNLSNSDKSNRKYCCEYCGHKFSSVQSLESDTCPRHPDGPNRGCHKLYEGRENNKENHAPE